MSDIQAFRGIRYDLGHVGSLGDVLCPAFDQCTTALQEQHYKRHPSNAIRLLDNRCEPGDSDDAPLLRAGKFFRNWMRQGVLAQDAHPAIYVCHQHFQWRGQPCIRRGFICRSRLESLDCWSAEVVGAPMHRRAQLQQQVESDLSPVLGLYADESNEVQSILEQAIIEVAPREATDHAGVTHRIWAVTDLGVIGDVVTCMSDKALHVAEGWATQLAATRLRDASDAATANPEHALQFLLTMCVSLSDPGLQLEPVCLVSRGEPARNSKEAIDEFRGRIDFTPYHPQSFSGAWEGIRTIADQGVLAMYCPGDQQWLRGEITTAGRACVAKAAPDRSEIWQDLGASAVQTLLQGADSETCGFSRLDAELASPIADIHSAVICPPPSAEHLQLLASIAESPPDGAVRPRPHNVAGLVFHPTGNF